MGKSPELPTRQAVLDDSVDDLNEVASQSLTLSNIELVVRVLGIIAPLLTYLLKLLIDDRKQKPKPPEAP